ncbi:peptidoglycan recognition protein [Streptomyces sp. NPDC005438]|uniref:peptidoglycan recognition protein family protein n=1 Tax=Streptomyces sp. NPDC005438 TaxID=3156880 RepID=UPI0033BEF04F
MRALLASSIGVTCAAAVLLPLSPNALAANGPTTRERVSPAGGTQALPLVPLSRSGPGAARGDRAQAAWRGLPAKTVKPFSLLGVSWPNADERLHGTVEVRTRAGDTGRWGQWRRLDTHGADAPDRGARERHGSQARGATAPLWVGASDGVRVRVRPEEGGGGLPRGLRLELVAPGGERTTTPVTRARVSERAGQPQVRAPQEPGAVASAAVNAELAPMGSSEVPALTREETRSRMAAGGSPRGVSATRAAARPHIVLRKGWGADESLREGQFDYGKTVRAAFVHHSADSDAYTCAEAPSVIRGIYRYHTTSLKWRDIGYNFLVDKCGKIYEGRAGGVERPVRGAHTLGFNDDTTGVAVLGDYSSSKASGAAVRAVSQLTAWKLGLFGVDARSRTTLTSAGGGKFDRGERVELNAVSGHRDGFTTSCPGDRLYGQLPDIRSEAGRLQG